MSAIVLLVFLMPPGPEPPIVGRPAQWPFSGASARFVRSGEDYVCPFRVSTSVSRQQLDARQELVLRVEIEALGPVLRPPEPINLREVTTFERSFFIASDARSIEGQAANRWVWVWRLRPRGGWVREVPGFPFLFYNPDLQPEEKGYQLLWTPSLRLEVEPDEAIPPPPEGPPEYLQAVGPEALNSVVWPRPGWGLALLFGVGPALGCVVWYLLWWWLYPDAVRLARLRRNRAAAWALGELDRLDRAPDAERLVCLLTNYLRVRFGLSVASPTPEEAAAVVPLPVRDTVVALWRDADAARFADGPCPEVGRIRQTILELEEQACQPSS